MKKLVAYFSASSVTKAAAEKLAKAAGADLFEIKPAVPYTRADLDWMNKKSRSSVEMSNPDSRPEIAEKLSNMDDYGTVFIGFPKMEYLNKSVYSAQRLKIEVERNTIHKRDEKSVYRDVYRIGHERSCQRYDKKSFIPAAYRGSFGWYVKWLRYG